MTKKERIHAEIEHLNEASLDEVDVLIQRLLQAQAETVRKPGVLSRLQRIKINAPEEFAANLGLYLSGLHLAGVPKKAERHSHLPSNRDYVGALEQPRASGRGN